ncbi:MAG: hypothetical protein J6K20_04935 [Thermoguttaceae bacterium]|nr:hypothetical protein [Thermoguttaceae bacterium]
MTTIRFTKGIVETAIYAIVAVLLLSVASSGVACANDDGENAVERAKSYCSNANYADANRTNKAFWMASILFTAAQNRDDVKSGFASIEIATIEIAKKSREGDETRLGSFEAVRVTFSDKSVRYYVPGPLGTEFDDVAELNSPTRSARLVNATKHETDLRGYYRRSAEQRVQEEMRAFVRLWRTASKTKNSGDEQLDFDLTIRDILAAVPISPNQRKASDDSLRRAYDGVLPRGEEAASAQAEEMEKIWKAADMAEASKTQAEATK